MPLALANPLSEEAATVALATLESELVFVLDNAEVPKALQAKIAAAGITSCAVFSAVESNIEGLKELVKTDLGMDPKEGIANKVAFAKISNAWEACQTRGKKRRNEEAEQRIGDLPLRLPKATHLVLKKAFTDLHKELDEKQGPHPDYIEAKLQQLEEGELTTERMQDIVCVFNDDGGHDVGFVVHTDGTMKARRSAGKKGTIPKTTEDLRNKFKIVKHMWEYVRLKSPALSFLRAFDMDIWDRYADFLLGETVFGLQLDSETVGTTIRPSWALLLEFDFEFRKKVAWTYNTKGSSMADCFKTVYADTTLYQTKFLSPMALHAGAAAARASAGSSSAPPSEITTLAHAAPIAETPPSYNTPKDRSKGDKGKGGKGKGGKGKNGKGGKGKAVKEEERNPDAGGQICYKFQRNACNDKNCKRRHVCMNCKSPIHGLKGCPSKSHPQTLS